MTTDPHQAPRPDSIDRALTLTWSLVALSVATAILGLFWRDLVLLSSYEGPDTVAARRDAEAQYVLSTALGGAARAALFALLAFFLGRRARWARVLLTLLTFTALVIGIPGLIDGLRQPLLLTLLQVGSAVVSGALLLALWRRPSTVWLDAGRRR